MTIQYVPKSPDSAYVADRLWLPKAYIRSEPVKDALEFSVYQSDGSGKSKLAQLKMWSESTHHILCPREFLPAQDYPKYRFPFLDIRPGFETARFEDLVTPRNEEQERAWQALERHDNGILQLGCGKGKTKLSLKKIAQKQTPTLVVVPDGGMLDQWRKSILGDSRTPAGLRVPGDIGIIQGDRFEWDKGPLTLALVTSLALRIRDGRVPEQMFRRYGLIVYDEVHLIGAPMFSLTAFPFYGDRIGLTATVKREDGLDPIYRYHIGEPFYADLKQDLIPDIFFQHTPVDVDDEDCKRNGLTNLGLLRGKVGRDWVGNVYRYWCIRQALEDGRKILVLGHSKDQLRLFHAMFPGSGLIISEVDYERRLDILRKSQVCFAIARLGSTGVDDDRLDALFWLTPFRSLIALQQSIGRIQRALPGKRQPYVVVFEDRAIKSLKGLCQSLRGTFRKWRMAFHQVPVRKDLPTELPADVRALYERAYAKLPERPDVDDGGDEEEEAGATPRRSCG